MIYNPEDVEVIRSMPRELAVALGLRKLAPRPDNIPTRTVEVEPIDTGGAFRPDWRMQDPSKDPKEPYGSESSGTGNDHGWSNCTMVSAALVYAYQVQDKTGPQGGDMRHNQYDLSGGTDLYDADTAWHNYGDQNLIIKTGAGWGEVKRYHNEGRAILIQGEGNVPGDESFDGSHACAIGPETNSEGKWLWGDPLATGWQWVPPSKIETWAKALHSGIMFAVSKAPPAPEPPEPEPEPKPPEDIEVPVVGKVDTAAVETSALRAYQSELLREMAYWFKHPEEKPPFAVGDTLAAIGHENEGWGVGYWNQTTWYLAPDAARWGDATWSGNTTGGRWV